MVVVCGASVGACDRGDGDGGSGGSPWDRGGGAGGGGGSGGLPLSLEEAAAAAVRVSACTGEDLGEVVLALGVAVTYPDAVGDVPEIGRCVQRAGDCAAVLRCLSYDPDATCDGPPSCLDAQTFRSCDSLENGLELVRDWPCSGALTGGDRCVAAESDTACGIGTCDEEDEPSRCEGDAYVRCDNGVLRRSDCRALGLVCTDLREGGDTGIVGCLPEGDRCTANTCDGHVLTVCEPFSGIALGRIDCADIDPALTCLPLDGTMTCGVPSDQASCEPETVTCEGAKARYCLGGFPIDLDCAGFLGGTCVPQGDDNARCKAPDWP